MIIRILGLILILILLYRVYMTVERRLLRKQIEKKDSNGQSKILQCQQCEVFIPADESIQHEGKVYCSKPCLDKAKGQDI